MNILGLVAYDSDSDHSTDEQTSELTQSVEYENASYTVLSEKIGSSTEDLGNTAELTASSITITQSSINNVPISSDSKHLNDSEAKYHYLHKLPALDPSILPDKNTTDSVNYYLEAMKTHNFNLTESIQTNKDFGNPYILLNVVDHFKIDERGSNYPKEIFDPHSYPESDFHDKIFRSNAPPQVVADTATVVSSAVATTAAVLSNLQQSFVHRTASYGQELNKVTQQNKSNNNNTNSSYNEDDYSSAIHAHVASSIANSVVTGGREGVFSSESSRVERKRKSKWDDPNQ